MKSSGSIRNSLVELGEMGILAGQVLWMAVRGPFDFASQAYVRETLGHSGPKDPLKVLATLEAMWIHSIFPDTP